jgi:CubicO group peptidase (beta-lactamase class C family)
MSFKVLLSVAALALVSTGAELGPQIDRILEVRFEAEDFNGTALIARGGQVVYERSFGLANREWGIPNDSRTKFELGSITKQFTALLILQFVNEGKIKLDGHVSEYLSWYRRDTGNRVTIHHLLSHTSGIPEFLAEPGFLEGPASRHRYGVKQFAIEHCSDDLQFEPGTRFGYSNSGYFLLGVILEQVSGETYESLLNQRIFGPLGMKDSGYTRSEPVLANRAAGYERTASGLSNARYYDMSIPFSAGAIYSTARDLYLWDETLYTNRLLPQNLQRLLFSPNLESYGYGWAILVPAQGSPYAGQSIPMHGGAIFGFQSVIQRIPNHHELIVLLDNTDSPKLLEVAQEIRRVLASTE